MIPSTRRRDLSSISLPSDYGKLRKLSPNAGLWLEKFILHQERLGDDAKKDTPKTILVKETAGVPVPEDYKNVFYPRWKAQLLSLQANASAKVGIAKVQGRIAVGLGNESVLETSVALHRTYGVPVIPGSALKGLASSFARNRCGGSWAKGQRAYLNVFGKTEESGYIVFHDALHVPGSAEGRPLRTDVIAVHHPDYYQNKKDSAPADWDDPNPIHFLSATGDYLIALSSVPGCECWLERAWEILRRALEHEGVGAKTSSGYGRLKFLE
jgi:CRISPR-associated protein Cmr6